MPDIFFLFIMTQYKYWKQIQIQVLIDVGWDQRILNWSYARHILSSSSETWPFHPPFLSHFVTVVIILQEHDLLIIITRFSPLWFSQTLCFSQTQRGKEGHVPLFRRKNTTSLTLNHQYLCHRHQNFKSPFLHWILFVSEHTQVQRTSLFSDVRMGVSLDERHKARLERMMMEEEEEAKGLEVS